MTESNAGGTPQPSTAPPVDRRLFLKGIVVAAASGLAHQACLPGGSESSSPGTTVAPPASSKGLLDDLLGLGRTTTTTSASPTTTVQQATSTTKPTASLGERWSDPKTWPNNRVPGPGDAVVVSKPIVVDVDAVVGSIVIQAAGRLVFDPNRSALLQSRGNVEVQGRLVMRPSSTSVTHTLRFIEVNESKFVGGGMKVLASDVGLWIVDNGVLDAAGAPKQAWTRATSALGHGATTVMVEDATGWQVGDSVVITATAPPTAGDSATSDVEYTMSDEKIIAAISGRRLTLDAPLERAHPKVTLTDWSGQAKSYYAEVLNLTRNVVIEGTPEGRTHVAFLHGSSPQRFSHVEVRHVGPRKAMADNANRSASVLGRYALHFHMCGDATRGSVLEGVVVHDCGGHAFVPHDSHGITLRDCVAHDVRKTPFWWDLRENDRPGTYQPATHDARWERCLASDVWADKTSGDESRNAGFSLAEGKDLSNSCVGCVAVGVRNWQGSLDNAQVSGFHWPESGGGSVWTFQDCLAHNIGGSGIFIWENDHNDHVIDRFTAYHSGAGITHGAYTNFYHYRRCALYANRTAGIAMSAITRRLQSTPATSTPISFEDIVIDGAGITRWGVQSRSRKFSSPAGEPLLLARLTVKNIRQASYYEMAQDESGQLQLVDCDFAAPEFYFDDDAPETVIDVKNLKGLGSFVLRAKDMPGAYVQTWNARRS